MRKSGRVRWIEPTPTGDIKPYRPGSPLRLPNKRTLCVIPAPPVRQGHDFSCGLGSGQSLLALFGKPSLREDQLIKRTKTSKVYGVHERELKKLLRQNGLDVHMKHRMSLAELAHYLTQGVPVVVGYQAWASKPSQWNARAMKGFDWRRENDSGHYSVAIGIDRKNIYFMDPAMDLGKRGYIPIAEFMKRWHWETGQHFGMVVSSDAPAKNRVFCEQVDRIY
ncbi:MAG: C39 family peptidase [Myxococcales bacterium]|nr:C39 family peptidase [Myxococcales bacterium]